MIDQPTMTQDEIEAKEARLEALAHSLLAKRDEAVAHRAASGIERMWRESQRAFDGVDGSIGKSDMMDYATGEAWLPNTNNQQKRSRVIINIIRGKCETAEGRFAEILLPSDDRNWGLLTTRVPQAAVKPAVGMLQPGQQPGEPMAQPQIPGQPPIPGEVSAPIDPAQAAKDDLEKRRGAMEEEIDDQLSECGYNGESRKAQRSAIRLGTGILKGPNVVKTTRRAWIEQQDESGTTYVMESVENLKPASKYVSVWDVYPDPNCGSNAKRGAYIWERDHILPREVKALVGVPGYQEQQLEKVLASPPVRTVVEIDKGGQQTKTTSLKKGAPYERWEYYGDIDKDDLTAMGCDCSDLGDSIPACVVFINDIPVKAVNNMLDTGELPYDFFQWIENEDSPWGGSEPMKIIWEQRVLTAAWREMMNNAGASSGPTIVMGQSVEPEDGDWTIQGNKVWLDTSEVGDVSKSFQQFQIQNNQKELENIIMLALKFTDLESGTPALAQGEKGSSPETLGGMQMLMNGADTTRRNQVKRYDDQITRPHISRYYHWNMQYNERQDIKGDFEVDARGTSVLLVKDQTAQSLMQILSLRADPEVNIQVDWGKAIRQLFQARHLDVLKPSEEVEADRKKLPPPMPPPQIAAAQIRAASAEKIEGMRAQEDASHHAADASLAMEEAKIKVSEDEKDRQTKMAVQMIAEKMQSVELSTLERQVLDKIKAELASVSMKLAVTKDLAVAQHAVDIHRHHNPVQKPVISPVIEPAGRAKPGQSFQQ